MTGYGVCGQLYALNPALYPYILTPSISTELLLKGCLENIWTCWDVITYQKWDKMWPFLSSLVSKISVILPAPEKHKHTQECPWLWKEVLGNELGDLKGIMGKEWPLPKGVSIEGNAGIGLCGRRRRRTRGMDTLVWSIVCSDSVYIRVKGPSFL